MRLDPGGLVEVADLSQLAPFHCNDMVVDDQGRAYVGNFGFDLDGGAEPTSTTLVCVEPDGEAWVVAEQLLFPNGMVIADGGRTLVVAESFGQRLSAYDLNADGSLANPRVWADLRPNVPDGICLDAAGGIWVADPINNGVMRVVQGAGPVDWIPTTRPAVRLRPGRPRRAHALHLHRRILQPGQDPRALLGSHRGRPGRRRARPASRRPALDLDRRGRPPTVPAQAAGRARRRPGRSAGSRSSSRRRTTIDRSVGSMPTARSTSTSVATPSTVE